MRAGPMVQIDAKRRITVYAPALLYMRMAFTSGPRMDIDDTYTDTQAQDQAEHNEKVANTLYYEGGAFMMVFGWQLQVVGSF